MGVVDEKEKAWSIRVLHGPADARMLLRLCFSDGGAYHAWMSGLLALYSVAQRSAPHVTST